MSQKTFIINSTQATFSDEELQFIQSLIYTEGVFGDPDTGLAGMAVKSQTTPNKSVRVAVGNSIINVTIDGRSFKSAFQNLAEETVTINDNTSGSARTDTIVAFLDTGTELDLLKTNVGSFRVIEKSGTTASTDAEIDIDLGSGNWLRLADIAVTNNFTTITNANITDRRNHISHTQAINASNALNPNLTQRETSGGGVDQEQTVNDHNANFGEADSTGENNKIAQSFIPTTPGIRGVTLRKAEDDGTFTGTVTIEVQGDNNGLPDGNVLATYTYTNDQWVEFGNYRDFICIFNDQYNDFEMGVTYWLVLSTSTSDSDNHPIVRTSDGNDYANGNLYRHNSTDGWSIVSGHDLYFQTLKNTKQKIVRTNALGQIPSNMLGTRVVYTDLNIGSIHNASITTDYEDYLTLHLHGIWELYALLKIEILFVCTVPDRNSPSPSHRMRMRIGSTTVFDLNVATSLEETSSNMEYRCVAKIFMQSPDSINEHVSSTLIQSVANRTGANEERERFPSYGTHQTSQGTFTDLLNQTLKVQLKNNNASDAVSHRYTGIIVEKSIVEQQDRQYYSPVF